MSDQSHFIGQIQQKEKEAAKLIEKAEEENNQRISAANEEAEKIISEAEEAVKKSGQERFLKAKEKAKEEYKRVLAGFDADRRDVIEGGKGHLDKAKQYVHEAFTGLFKE